MQEEINTSQDVDGGTHDSEVEESKPVPPSVTKGTQVEEGVLHYIVFHHLGCNV